MLRDPAKQAPRSGLNYGFAPARSRRTPAARYALRPCAKRVAFTKIQIAEFRRANAGRVFQHGLETRARSSPGELEITFRTSRGRGLLLQRLAEIVGALAQFVEQPRVLDGDDGLGGEVLHQLDLFIGERPDLLAIDDDGADQLVLLEHRYKQSASERRQIRRGLPRRGSRLSITLLRREVGNVDDLLGLRRVRPDVASYGRDKKHRF